MDAVLRLRRHGRGRAAERGRGAWTRLHACAGREIIGEICFGCCRDLVTGRGKPPAICQQPCMHAAPKYRAVPPPFNWAHRALSAWSSEKLILPVTRRTSYCSACTLVHHPRYESVTHRPAACSLRKYATNARAKPQLTREGTFRPAAQGIRDVFGPFRLNLSAVLIQGNNIVFLSQRISISVSRTRPSLPLVVPYQPALPVPLLYSAFDSPY